MDVAPPDGEERVTNGSEYGRAGVRKGVRLTGIRGTDHVNKGTDHVNKGTNIRNNRQRIDLTAAARRRWRG